ncbi:MAG: prolipoprotein diacylglyceryl transferase [Pseudomonadota bacterium]
MTGLPLMALAFPQIDPAIVTVELFGTELSLRWYALAYIAGLVLGWRVTVWLMRRPRLWPHRTPPMPPDAPEDLLTWMVVGVVLGGRLGYVLFYNPLGFLERPQDVLAIWQGGMSFHGGFIGVMVALALFCRNRRIPLLQAGDAVALAAPFGLFFGRIANFINGELWGRPTEVSWGMVFPTVPPELWVGSVNLPRHPSQLYEAAGEGLILAAVMWWLALARGWLRRPGALIGLFFIGYGLARSLIENFRQGDIEMVTPDNPWGHAIRFGLGPEAMGLTMGQVLSLPMVAIGAGFLWLAWQNARREAAAGETGGDGGNRPGGTPA